MKISGWQSVIISWANSLNLLEDPVIEIIDLIRRPYFIELIERTESKDNLKNKSNGNEDIYKVIENFLKAEFVGFRLLGYWDSDEVTLVSSVILLWASLESQDFRTPLYGLHTALQLKIQAFIERFVYTPRHLVNRQLVMDAVLDVASDDENEEGNSSFVSSPRSYTTPTGKSNLQSPRCLTLSEIRSLRSKVDLLNCEKQHLQEELDLNKHLLTETSKKLESKVTELARLKTQVYSNLEESEKVFEENGGGDMLSDMQRRELDEDKNEIVKLREDIQRLETALIISKEDLDHINDEKKSLLEQHKDEISERRIVETKCMEFEMKNTNLTSKVHELEGLVSSLKSACEEQSAILSERSRVSFDESFQFVDTETLESVVDMKCAELQEELRQQGEQLEERLSELKSMTEEKDRSSRLIAELQDQIKLSKVEYICKHCDILKDEVRMSAEELKERNIECDKLRDRLESKCNDLKICEDSKKGCEELIAELKKEMNVIMSEYSQKDEDRKDEILTLKCELCEKNNNLEDLKDELEFLNKCLVDKTSDLKILEDDYSKMIMSKDKGISQLRATIEQQSKEVACFQEQLHGEYFKNEKLIQSACQWREKLSQGSVAQDELARELIELNETLEWKNLTIKDMALQIDHLRAELLEKETSNKEILDRLSFLSERNKENRKELQLSKKSVSLLKSKVDSLKFNKERIEHQLHVKKREVVNLETEMKEFKEVLQEKFNKIESKINSKVLQCSPGLDNLIDFADCVNKDIIESKQRITDLNCTVSQLRREMEDKTTELEYYSAKFEELAVSKGHRAIDKWKKENTEIKEKLKNIEIEYNNKCKCLNDSLGRLDSFERENCVKIGRVAQLEDQVKMLSGKLKEKQLEIDNLQQNVTLYEHEKNILGQKIQNMFEETQKTDSMKAENKALKMDVVNLEKKLQEERDILRSVENQIDIEDQMNNSFDERLLQLQTKMKSRLEEELSRAAEEHTKKIEQLRGKVKKDCLHIENLSSELWETSDRLLLSQQEAEALRSQLKVAKQRLAEQQFQSVQDSSSFLWLGGTECDRGWVDEMVTVTRHRTLVPGQATSTRTTEDEEVFSQQCLEDLKAGICRLPPQERLSCPPYASAASSLQSFYEEDKDVKEVFLQPSEPNKSRKLKGSIAYRKPGPPTPSIHAARHSLPGNEKLEMKRGLREQNANTCGQARSRLSQIFGSIAFSKPKPMDSPKLKRKGFFQRTFRNRENLPPK